MEETMKARPAVDRDDRPMGELERLSMFLGRQEELLQILASRLQPVSHPTKLAEGGTPQNVPSSTHISSQIDRVQTHNSAIEYLLESLAV